MRLRYEFVTMPLGDRIVAAPVGDHAADFHGVLKMNEMAADILDQLREDTTPERVHVYLKNKYPEATDQEIGETLAAFLNQLVREGILIAP